VAPTKGTATWAWACCCCCCCLRNLTVLVERVRALLIARPALGAVTLASLALAFLSVLPDLVLGGVSLPLPVPGPLLRSLSAFRANGRFVWPLMYLTVLIGVVSARRVLPRAGTALVVVAVLLQVIDLQPVFSYVSGQTDEALAGRPRYQAELATALRGPGVDAVDVVPAYPHPPTVPWREIGFAAQSAGLPLTSLGYFNRYDVAELVRLREQGTARLRAHELRADTVYVVEQSLYDRFLEEWAGAVVLVRMDGWLAVRRADAVPGLVPAPAVATGTTPVRLRAATGFSSRETDPTGRSGYWLTSPRGELKVTGQPSSRVSVSLTPVAAPCGPLSGTVGGASLIAGRRTTVGVRLGPDGAGSLPVTAQNSPCRLAGDARTLFLLVYDPVASTAR
jgi:hypothetical protein